MEATVKRYIAANVHKAIEKMSKSEGAGCAAMKELLAQPALKLNFFFFGRNRARGPQG